jgi:hypothetical protein
VSADKPRRTALARKACFRFADPEKRNGALHWVPDDFPYVGPPAAADFPHGVRPLGLRDRHKALCDGLIMKLINARNDLAEPDRAPAARALIEKMVHALRGYSDGTLSRHELLVSALDGAAREESANWGTLLVSVTLDDKLPGVKVPYQVLYEAVRLWPQTRQREARTRAVRAVARALGCDAKDGRTLMTMLRQARTRLRQRRADARRK